MDLKGKLRKGMRIVGPDDRDYGAIERWDDEFVYLHGKRIPVGMIERMEKNRLYVGAAGAGSFAEQGVEDAGLGGEVRVPVVEERLAVGRRQIDLGEIQVHKTVDTVEERRQEPVTRDDVQIERIRVNRTVGAPETPREEDGWLIIPVMEEVLVIQKQLVVTEEIRIRKQSVTEQREIRETLRREQVSVDDTRTPMPGGAEATSRSTTEDPSWQELREEIRGDAPIR
jgi:uncharacterized protein (TIGR02271 family)